MTGGLPPAVWRIQQRLARTIGLGVGEALFSIIGAGCLLASLGLALLPSRRISGPALVVVYGIVPRPLWAVAFAVAGALPLLAVLRPSPHARLVTYMVLLPLGTWWTLGLAWPLFTDGPANMWAPLVAGVLTLCGAAMFVLLPFDSSFYDRPPRHPREPNSTTTGG